MKRQSKFYTDGQDRVRYIGGKKSVQDSTDKLLRAPQRKKQGQFITKDGKIIFVGGPGSGGGSGSSIEDAIASRFEEVIQEQENAIRNQEKPDWYSDEEWQDKIDKRVRNVVVGVDSAQNIPGIELIIPGQQAKWRNYFVERQRVDQLDNIYVSRIRK